MKMHSFLVCLFLCGLLPFIAQAQKTIEEVVIVAFEPPYDVITLLVDEKQYDYQVNETTSFVNIKNKQQEVNDFIKGCAVNLTYDIENRKRVAQQVQMVSADGAGTENFRGVFELLEDDIAYIDGKKVILCDETSIDCSGYSDCGCSRGMSYLDFAELNIGDFLTVKGKMNAEGVVVADQISVCQNEYTSTDRELRTAVENSYDASGSSSVTAPTGISVPANSLYRGNIRVGSLNYKLLDDIRVQGYVNMVGNRILPDYAKDPEFQEKHEIFFRFYAIDSPIPNAFAFPNGMVFINTGLMKIIENEAQLAAVLGHEIAHVTYEHASSRYATQSLITDLLGDDAKEGLGSLLSSTLGIEAEAGSMVDGMAQGLNEVNPSSLSNLFSKSNETQSDRVGLLYMYLAGYDVREAGNFWKNMTIITGDETFKSKMKEDARKLVSQSIANKEQGLFAGLAGKASKMVLGNLLNTIYTSHPLTEKRLSDINSLLLTVYGDEDFSQYIVAQEDYDKYLSSTN
jgi:Zn-dependent protease with chaperone function